MSYGTSTSGVCRDQSVYRWTFILVLISHPIALYLVLNTTLSQTNTYSRPHDLHNCDDKPNPCSSHSLLGRMVLWRVDSKLAISQFRHRYQFDECNGT